MKSAVNKFDYPTASTHAYKLYKQQKAKPEDPEAQKIKYRQFDKEQREIQRAKAQQQKNKKLEQERKENKRKLEQELDRKKRELIELEKMKSMAVEAEKKSRELALIRQEQERLQKIEQERRAKQNQSNAQNRFLEALRRLEQQKEQINRKQKQAMYRRKVIEETEKLERGKAIKYRQELQQKERSAPVQQKRTFNNYKQNLGRTAYNRTVDYTRTFLHNPSIIISNTEEQETAIQRADRHNSREREKSEDRRSREEADRKAREERGRTAMQKLQLQREYQEYLREHEEKAKQFNLERIEAGKKNPYVGVKPSTLVQMEQNKKLRGEQQFEKLFFGGQNPEWFDKPASRHNIVQHKLVDSAVSNAAENSKYSVPARSLGSVGPAVSDSHYSFESEGIEALTSVKKNQAEEGPEQRKRVIPLARPINQAEQSRHREELSYSQSQDQQE